MRFLVTGASGFVGPYLCRRLVDAGHEVVSAARDGVVDYRLDVCRTAELQAVFDEVRPDGVFHLAAVAFMPEAERAPELADAVNRRGTANVLDAAAAVDARTLVVSSGSVYGKLPVPATEDMPLAPEGIYARSKADAERECRTRAGRQAIIVMRPFNHAGPGQSSRYVCSDFASQIAACEAGHREPVIEVGDLSAERDFCDVGDVVDAYARAFFEGAAGEVYNVCSGRPRAISEILDCLLTRARIKIDVRVVDQRLRRHDVDRMVGSYRKIEQVTGWHPAADFERTLAAVLDDWRRRIDSAEPSAGSGRASRNPRTRARD